MKNVTQNIDLTFVVNYHYVIDVAQLVRPTLNYIYCKRSTRCNEERSMTYPEAVFEAAIDDGFVHGDPVTEEVGQVEADVILDDDKIEHEEERVQREPTENEQRHDDDQHLHDLQQRNEVDVGQSRVYCI